MTDLTAGKVFDRVAMTWVDPDEYARRRAAWQEMAFLMKGNQGELATPMVIFDTQRPVQSMTNGQVYDSKSELRKEYRRADVIEVGNDVPMSRPKPTRDERDRERKKRRGAIERAFSKAGFGA